MIRQETQMETLTNTKTQAQPDAATSAPVEETPRQDAQSAAVEEKLKIEGKAKSGANWFFWIAALSLINSIMTMAGTEWGFIMGLGITQVFDAVGAELGGARFVTFAMSVLCAGVFVFFGAMANKRLGWAYVTGMVLYAMDGLWFLLVGDLLGVGFHVFVLFWVFNGYRAHKALATR